MIELFDEIVAEVATLFAKILCKPHIIIKQFSCTNPWASPGFFPRREPENLLKNLTSALKQMH